VILKDKAGDKKGVALFATPFYSTKII